MPQDLLVDKPNSPQKVFIYYAPNPTLQDLLITFVDERILPTYMENTLYLDMFSMLLPDEYNLPLSMGDLRTLADNLIPGLDKTIGEAFAAFVSNLEYGENTIFDSEYQYQRVLDPRYGFGVASHIIVTSTWGVFCTIKTATKLGIQVHLFCEKDNEPGPFARTTPVPTHYFNFEKDFSSHLTDTLTSIFEAPAPTLNPPLENSQP